MPNKKDDLQSYVPFIPLFLRVMKDDKFAAKLSAAFASGDNATSKRLIKSAGVTIKFELLSDEEHAARHAKAPTKRGTIVANRMRQCFKLRPDGPYFCV